MCHPLWSEWTDSEQETLMDRDQRYDNLDRPDLNGWATTSELSIFREEEPTFRLMVYLDPAWHFRRFEFTNLRMRSSEFDLKPASGNLLRIQMQDIQRVPSQNTGSEHALKTAETWLQDCLTIHARYNQSLDGNQWYPTRLLDLGVDLETPCSHVRLIESTAIALVGSYCTLSHCWGDLPIVRFTQETMGALHLGLPLDNPPKTFREAIFVTKHLGARYLWIDSLCIQQDSEVDLNRESGLMENVYSHSLCNLSASDSRNSMGGLFRNRPPAILANEYVVVNVESFQHGLAYVECEIHDRHLWSSNVSECILHQRARVMQERILAPRVLHFGRSQLSWECLELEACERHPSGLPSQYSKDVGTNFKAQVFDPRIYLQNHANQDDSELDRRSGGYRVWHAITPAYSRASLTVPSDKLVTLSGVAKRMMPIMNNTYLAGMWRKHLNAALFWRVWGWTAAGSPFPNRPKHYRAPSWSWASVDGPVIMSSGFESFIKIEDVFLDYETEDPTGMIKEDGLI